LSESASKSKRKMRMTLPKKREDLEKVMEEVEATHPEHHHHHHHHEDLGDFLAAFEYLLDSLSANVKVLESTVKNHSFEIAKIYKVLSKIVEACFSEDKERRKYALLEAIKLLGAAS